MGVARKFLAGSAPSPRDPPVFLILLQVLTNTQYFAFGALPNIDEKSAFACRSINPKHTFSMLQEILENSYILEKLHAKRDNNTSTTKTITAGLIEDLNNENEIIPEPTNEELNQYTIEDNGKTFKPEEINEFLKVNGVTLLPPKKFKNFMNNID